MFKIKRCNQIDYFNFFCNLFVCFRSYGNTLTLEIFRRNTSRNGSVPSVRRLTSTGTESTTGLPVPQQRRPSTVCSTNTTSVEYNRKRLQLPQIAFNVEVGKGVIV